MPTRKFFILKHRKTKFGQRRWTKVNFKDTS